MKYNLEDTSRYSCILHKVESNQSTHDSNYEFIEIKERWGAVNNYVYNQPKNLIKCRRANNNGQPQQTSENKNLIGKWAIGTKRPTKY